MDLSRIAVALRPRNAWEAIDLGFAMARRWFLPLWLLWLCAAVPVYLAAAALLPPSSWLVPTLVVWWFKPLYEPPLLYWSSRALFEDPPDRGDMRRRWRRIVAPRLLANLTWRRFDPYRSFHMAVTVLEGLQGAAHRDRTLVLGRNQHAAAWLTVLGLSFEAILELSFIVLIVMMIPAELRWADAWTLVFGAGQFTWMLGELGALLAMSVMAPFYVNAGFSLYLNRRSELEGWDIELGFRRMAGRYSKPVTGIIPAGAVLGLAGLLVLANPAAEAAATVPDRQQARTLVQEVLAHPDFGHRQTDAYWAYVGDGDEPEEDDPGPFAGWLEWMASVFAGFLKGIAAVGEVLLWLAAGFLLAFAVAWAIRHRGGPAARATGAAGRDAPAARLLELDVAPESLPGDVPAAAGERVERGDLRGALSLLYRGALARFVADRRPDIPPGATEGECLALVQRHRPAAQSAYLGELTRAWVLLAYAHRPPTRATVRALCRRWHEVAA